MTLHFILACHNRRLSTLTCLMAAAESARSAKVSFDFTLFDDGSGDGTAEAVLSEFPHTVVIQGNGSNFWAKSMFQAESSLLNRVSDDIDAGSYVVWLNDDVILDENAIARLLTVATAMEQPSIIVGAMRDPRTGVTSYSGLNRQGPHPLSFRVVTPQSTPLPVEAFNGNLVLVPLDIATRLRGIDGDYAHGMADIDYGIRAGKLGISNILAPGTYGVCPRNEPAVFKNIRSEWRRFTGPKGAGNFGSLRKILKLTTPKLWPIYLIATYFLWICKTSAHAINQRRA